MTIYKKLSNVQFALKAPKSQFNKFGGFHYRSLEDILEAAKPLLHSEGLTLILSDEPINVDGWHYIKAVARLIDVESGETIETAAVAREPKDKKGMDDSQISGATSSYARKYLLNALFCVDDTKDADADVPRNDSTHEVMKVDVVIKAIQSASNKDEWLAADAMVTKLKPEDQAKARQVQQAIVDQKKKAA